MTSELEQAAFNYHKCNNTILFPIDFGPISVTGGSHIEFDLGYDYFFHTASSIEANSQTLVMSIVSATTDPSGVLFYFKTDTSVHLLEVIDA